jgi:hypothetical protein
MGPGGGIPTPTPDPRLGRSVGVGPGWDRAAEKVREMIPRELVEQILLYRPYRREGREWGTAAVLRRDGPDRHTVFTVRYMVVLRGKERGKNKVEFEEVGAGPQDVVAKVLEQVAERAGDVDAPTPLDVGTWYPEVPDDG